MKKNKKVVDVLLKALAEEHTALIQYMAHHYAADDAGYSKLADMIKRESVEEMKHAEHLAERLTFLGETPPYHLSHPPAIKKVSIEEALKADMLLEEGAIEMYNSGIKTCMEEGDAMSRVLLEKILEDEEKHYKELSDKLDLIKRHGDAYLVTLI